MGTVLSCPPAVALAPNTMPGTQKTLEWTHNSWTLESVAQGELAKELEEEASVFPIPASLLPSPCLSVSVVYSEDPLVKVTLAEMNWYPADSLVRIKWDHTESNLASWGCGKHSVSKRAAAAQSCLTLCDPPRL